MAGNVWEWVQDRWHDNYRDAPNDGSAWEGDNGTGGGCVLRGRSWFDKPDNVRSAYRSGYNPGNRLNNYGFRLARTL